MRDERCPNCDSIDERAYNSEKGWENEARNWDEDRRELHARIAVLMAGLRGINGGINDYLKWQSANPRAKVSLPTLRAWLDMGTTALKEGTP